MVMHAMIVVIIRNWRFYFRPFNLKIFWAPIQRVPANRPSRRRKISIGLSPDFILCFNLFKQIILWVNEILSLMMHLINIITMIIKSPGAILLLTRLYLLFDVIFQVEFSDFIHNITKILLSSLISSTDLLRFVTPLRFEKPRSSNAILIWFFPWTVILLKIICKLWQIELDTCGFVTLLFLNGSISSHAHLWLDAIWDWDLAVLHLEAFKLWTYPLILVGKRLLLV